MAAYIKIPRPRDSAVLDVIDFSQTAVQRALRRGALAEYEGAFQATLFAACDIANRAHSLVLFDVGAHIGLYSALIEIMFGARCVAFEPTPSTADVCATLRAVNRLKFEIVRSALSTEEGTATFYLSTRTESSNSLNPAFRPGGAQITVPVTTLDTFCARHEAPTVLKIDAETHDAEVILGGMRMIQKARPTITCEILRKTNRARMGDALTRLFSIGYSAINPEHPAARHTNAETVFAQAKTVAGWVLMPDVPDDFVALVGYWRGLIAACTRETNRVVDNSRATPG